MIPQFFPEGIETSMCGTGPDNDRNQALSKSGSIESYFIINRPKTVAIKAAGGCTNRGDRNTGLHCIKHETDLEFPLGLVQKML